MAPTHVSRWLQCPWMKSDFQGAVDVDPIGWTSHRNAFSCFVLYLISPPQPTIQGITKDMTQKHTVLYRGYYGGLPFPGALVRMTCGRRLSLGSGDRKYPGEPAFIFCWVGKVFVFWLVCFSFHGRCPVLGKPAVSA